MVLKSGGKDVSSRVGDGSIACLLLLTLGYAFRSEWFFLSGFTEVVFAQASEGSFSLVRSMAFFFGGFILLLPLFFKPSLHDRFSRWFAAVMLFCTVGTWVVQAASAFGEPASLFIQVLGVLLMGLGWAGSEPFWIETFSEIGSFKKRIAVIAGSYVLSGLTTPFVRSFVSPDALSWLLLALPIASFCLFHLSVSMLLPSRVAHKASSPYSVRQALAFQVAALAVAPVLLRAFENGSLWGSALPGSFHPLNTDWLGMCLGSLLFAGMVGVGVILCGKRREDIRYRVGILLLLAALLSILVVDDASTGAVALIWATEGLGSLLFKAMLSDAANLFDCPKIRICAAGSMCQYVACLVAAAFMLIFSPQTRLPLFFLVYLLTLVVALVPTSFFIRRDAMPTRSSAGGESDSVLELISYEFGLSPREKEVFVLLAVGRNVPYVQEALYISDGTAKTHVKRIYKKLGIHSRQELVELVSSYRLSAG